MRVHNLYSDLLRSLTYFFDNIVYDPTTIRHYEFNIGNHTFQLDHKTQYELPAAIIRLQNASPLNLHPLTIQHIPVSNVNRIPVIYNRSKDLTVEVQEEHFLITIDITINCESQFQAKDMEFQLMSVLPLNKWIRIYEFTSFIEIEGSKYLADPDILDVQNHDIVNLFTKFDFNLAKPVHCFAIQYAPYMKLDSATVNIPSSAEHSYALDLSLSYMITMPQYLNIPIEDRPRRKLVDNYEREIVRNNVIWSNPENDTHALRLELIDVHDNSHHVPIICPYSEDVNFIDPVYYNVGNFKSKLKQEIIKAKFEWINLSVANTPVSADLDAELILIINLDLSKSNPIVSTTAEVRGELDGRIMNIVHNPSTKILRGVFDGVCEGVHVKDAIELQYIELCRSFKISYNNFPKIPNYKMAAERGAQIIPETYRLFDLVPGLNENKVNPILDQFVITHIYILDTNSNYVYDIDVNSNLDSDGNFKVQFYIPDLQVNGLLVGQISKHSKLISYNLTYTDTDYTSDILPLFAIQFNTVFLYKPSYGGSYIERISLNINTNDSLLSQKRLTAILNPIESPPINPYQPIESRLIPLFNNNDNKKYIESYFEFNDNGNNLDIDYHTFTIKWLKKRPSYDIWCFHINNTIFDSRTHNIESTLWLIDEDDKSMTFGISKKLYYRVIAHKVSSINPVIFYLYRIVK